MVYDEKRQSVDKTEDIKPLSASAIMLRNVGPFQEYVFHGLFGRSDDPRCFRSLLKRFGYYLFEIFETERLLNEPDNPRLMHKHL